MRVCSAARHSVPRNTVPGSNLLVALWLSGALGTAPREQTACRIRYA